MKTCDAKTRRGTACRRAPMPNGRCSKHGGKSLKHYAHPNFKHGRYSKYSGIPEQEQAERLEKKLKKKREQAMDQLINKFITVNGREPDLSEWIEIFRKVRLQFAGAG